MAKATLSTTVDYEIAKRLEDEAIKQNITVSHLIRNLLIEKYKGEQP